MSTVIRYWEEQVPKVLAQRLEDESDTQKIPLGYIHKEANGDEYVYCKNGAATLAPGKLIQSVAGVAGHLNEAVAAAVAVGANVITVTLTTGVTANDFAEGYIHVNDAAGEGHTYRIYSHDTAADTGVCTFTIYGSVIVALTTSSEVTITRNPCSAVIVTAGGAYPTAKVVGVPQRSVTIAYYFWAKKKGFSAVLAAGTVVVARRCAATDDAIPGGVEPYVITQAAPILNTDIQLVGIVIQANVNTEYALVDLDL